MGDKCCKMKGFLTFLVLWTISKHPCKGACITKELEKRKGTKPSPGTVYPVLKELKEKGLIEEDEHKYTLTAQGKKELNEARKAFSCIFYDHDEICKC